MANQNGPAERKHVLVVDDDIELALTFQALLEVHGFEASTAENGTQALRLVLSTQVDAILCDLNMPELTGDLFYLEVARARPHLTKRFIFVTAYAENPLYGSFLKNVKAPVLAKPVSFASLLAKLQELLHHPEPGPVGQPKTSSPSVSAN